MRQALSGLSLLLILLVAISAVAGPRSPLPDMDEREAFQRQELERRASWVETLKAPVTTRSFLQDRYDVTYYRLALDVASDLAPLTDAELGTLPSAARGVKPIFPK